MRISRIVVAAVATLFVVGTANAQTPAPSQKPAVRRPVSTAPAAAKPVEAPKPVEESKPKAFTNADVIKLKAAEFKDDAIAAAITIAPNKQFDTSADGLIALRTAGISQAVIDVVLGKPYVTPPPAPVNVSVVEPIKAVEPTAASEKKGGIGGFVGGLGRHVGINRGDDKDKKNYTTAVNAEEVRVKDGEAAIIKVEMPTQAAEASVKAYFNSQNIDFTVNPDTNRIISGWYGARRCGPGIQHCEYRAHVRVVDNAGATDVQVQVFERKREGGASPKGWNENNTSKGEWTTKLVADLRPALTRTTTTASR
ncbi:MAG: hypothetical protein KW804_03250 [Candidatus Doudnabacteria bacterium]|nr:hypothetical protein [Candidatus Doudnabacteria bacterium]